uniref:Regulator of chromosome condensation 1 n=1 Tax=Eptatretus burgeri TaxID=7764 RepID=A0A8C4Q289_EPTBU
MVGKRGRQPKRTKSSEGCTPLKNDTAKRLKVSHSFHGDVPGTVLTLGQGDVGQLGLGTTVVLRRRPGLVNLPELAVQVTAGGMHTACLGVSGKVYTFGCNDEGALGRLTANEEEEARPGLVEISENIVQLSAGDSHTAALTASGKVYFWGAFRDNNGVIGLLEPLKTCPLPVHLPVKATIIKVASGNNHLCLLSVDGDLFTLGCGEQGQLGRVPSCFTTRGGRRGLEFFLQPLPVRLHCTTFLKDVFCAAYGTFIITRSNDVFGFGLSNFYQLGEMDSTMYFMPQLLSAFQNSGKVYVSFSGGQHHTLCMDSEGFVYSLGRAHYGRLGLGTDAKDEGKPQLVPDVGKAVAVACGSSVSYAITQEVNNPLPCNLKSEARKAAKILQQFTEITDGRGPDKIIPPHIIGRAKGLAILSVFKVGFLVTARAGSGIVVAQLDGYWSAPSAVGIAGLGGGFEIGFEVSDLVIILNTQKAVEAFTCGSNVTLGGNLTVSIGPLGRAVEADVAMRRTAAMFTYCRSRGLFAGISLEGAYLFQRKDANQKFYCGTVRVNDILAGTVEPPAVAQELYEQLSKYGCLADKHDKRKTEWRRTSNERRRTSNVRRRTSNERRRSSDERTRPQSMMLGSSPAVHCKHSRSAERWDLADSGSLSGSSSRSNESLCSMYPKAVALRSFTGRRNCELSFKSGDTIIVLTQTSKTFDWWEGRIGEHVGLFPANYISFDTSFGRD